MSLNSDTKDNRLQNSLNALVNLKEKVENIKDSISMLFISVPEDIVDAIKQDHRSLRNFLGVLKNLDGEVIKRREAFAAFSSLLKSHTTAEEQIVYTGLVQHAEQKLKMKVSAGYVEHQVADDLMRRAEKVDDMLTWGAYANVLSESVEHHLAEEERELLPKINELIPEKERKNMLHEFIRLREKPQHEVLKENAGVLEAVIQT